MKYKYLKALSIIAIAIMVISCNKEKKYRSKVLGTWDIYKVEYSTNYYEIDSIIIDNTINDYGEITFTKDETSTTYQTMDIAYEGILFSEYLSTSPSTNEAPFVYEVFQDHIITHGGLLELGGLYFDFESKKEMTVVTGVNYNPGGSIVVAYQTTYYFRKI